MLLKHNRLIDSVERIGGEDFDRSSFAQMDKNERIIDLPEEFVDQIRARVSSHILTSYPNVDEVQKLVAAENGLMPEQVLLSAGSEYAIKSIIETFVEDGTNIVVHQPGYAMYPVYAKLRGAAVISVDYGDNLELDISDIIRQIDERTRLVVMENPNGFIGSSFQLAEIQEVAEVCLQRCIPLVVDEAYFHFSDITCLGLIPEYQNLIITRTYSKAFGFAGVRVGYCLAQASTMELIRKNRPMHEINGFACEVVKLIHENISMIRDYVGEIRKNSAYFVSELSRVGVEAIGAPTNFILVSLPDELDVNFFKAHKILVRRPFSEAFLQGYTRVTVGGKKQVDRFVGLVATAVGTK